MENVNTTTNRDNQKCVPSRKAPLALTGRIVQIDTRETNIPYFFGTKTRRDTASIVGKTESRLSASITSRIFGRANILSHGEMRHNATVMERGTVRRQRETHTIKSMATLRV